MIVKMERDGII